MRANLILVTTMAKRRKGIHEAAPLTYLPCFVCRREGIVGVEVAPYWWGKPIEHTWCHSACAEKYQRALAAARRERAIADCKQEGPEGR